MNCEQRTAAVSKTHIKHLATASTHIMTNREISNGHREWRLKTAKTTFCSSTIFHPFFCVTLFPCHVPAVSSSSVFRRCSINHDICYSSIASHSFWCRDRRKTYHFYYRELKHYTFILVAVFPLTLRVNIRATNGSPTNRIGESAIETRAKIIKINCIYFIWNVTGPLIVSSCFNMH